MRYARRNPIGSPVPKDTIVVRVGIGVHTHIFHPEDEIVICNSGKNAGRVGESGEDNRGKEQNIYKSNANMVTCYRCQKLMRLNLAENRRAWEGPNRSGRN